MTKKPADPPQETFDHGQARLLPTPLRPSELIKRLQLIFAEEQPHSEDPSIMLWGPPGVKTGPLSNGRSYTTASRRVANTVWRHCGGALLGWCPTSPRRLEPFNCRCCEPEAVLTRAVTFATMKTRWHLG